MIKRVKQAGVWGLTLALTFSGLVLSNVYAADTIKVNEKCALQISLKESGFSELSGQEALPVEVALYKVANVDIGGNYKVLTEYEALDLSVIDSETTPEEWIALAASAKAEVVSAELEAFATKNAEYGEAIFTNLETGLYLLDVQQASSDEYVYEFTPFMVALPYNNFYNTSEDAWIYDMIGENAIDLKVLRTERFGDLAINKLLDTYNASIGGATFVFQIEATKTDIDLLDTDPQKTRVVYSDVVSMTFNGTGQDSIIIEDIPAGSDVTVTEIYSGASYKITTEAEKQIKIVAEEVTAVDFENTYDDHLNGGNGVVNSFLYDSENENWIPTATEDSTP